MLIASISIAHLLLMQNKMGFLLLELYISSYLVDNVRHLCIEDKRALRQCCKRFKALFDATITCAYISKAGTVSFGSKTKLIEFRDHDMTPNVDLIVNTFPSLEIFKVVSLSRHSSAESLGKLISLTNLHISSSDTGFIPLPVSMSRLKTLKSVYANSVTTDSLHRLACCSLLESLDLSGLVPTHDIPEIISSFSSLTSLSISSSPDGNVWEQKIASSEKRSLPKDVGNLGLLQRLHCRVRLTDFPPSFGNLTHLTSLYLQALEYLPECIGNFANLTNIGIEYSRNLHHLPASLCKLHSLKILKLGECGVMELPQDIGNLHLICLELRKVELVVLPDSLTRLKLEQLVLSDCEQLARVPEGLTCMTSLKQFTVAYCPKVVVPKVFEQHFTDLLVNVGNKHM